ncbi:MAG: hypothetical protein ACOCV8_05040 [Spirochaetota bacterium]
MKPNAEKKEQKLSFLKNCVKHIIEATTEEIDEIYYTQKSIFETYTEEIYSENEDSEEQEPQLIAKEIYKLNLDKTDNLIYAKQKTNDIEIPEERAYARNYLIEYEANRGNMVEVTKLSHELNKDISEIKDKDSKHRVIRHIKDTILINDNIDNDIINNIASMIKEREQEGIKLDIEYKLYYPKSFASNGFSATGEQKRKSLAAYNQILTIKACLANKYNLSIELSQHKTFETLYHMNIVEGLEPLKNKSMILRKKNKDGSKEIIINIDKITKSEYPFIFKNEIAIGDDICPEIFC